MCSLPTKVKILLILAKTFEKQRLNVCSSAIFHMKTSVILKYFLVTDCICSQIWIREVTVCQIDSIMTLNCELGQSEFSVLSGNPIIKFSKTCFLCTYVDKMIIQPRLMFCSKFSFTMFLLIFFLLLSNVFTDVLKIDELPKIYNKIPKYCQTLVSTIIIYHANSMSQLHLASELYPY